MVECWARRVHLINGFGPAEASIKCAANLRVSPHHNVTNIGKALPLASLWIASSQNRSQLAAISATGELIIEGPGVGRGYLKDPDRTALAFFNTPTQAPQSLSLWRFFATGDLVRYAADGSFICLGR